MAKRRKNRAGTFTKDDPRINRTIAGPGRPSEAFKRFCRRLLARQQVNHAIRDVVQNKHHPQFMSAYKTMAAYGYGQPQASVEVKGKLSLEQILARSWDKPKGEKKRRKGTSR